MLGVIHVEMTAVGAGCILHPLCLLFPTRRSHAAIHVVIGPLMTSEIPCRIYWRSCLEHKDLEAAFGKLFGSHPARGA